MVERRDRTGDRVGSLTVTGYSHSQRTPSGALVHYWKVLCDCGNTSVFLGCNLRARNGSAPSCGCVKRARLGEETTTHGATKGRNPTPEHRSWTAMLARCRNPNRWQYPYYGGRGIRVCSRWESFASFLADMGPRGPITRTLDRIDNERGYDCGDHEHCPDCKARGAVRNCRWADKSRQANNSRRCHTLTHSGQTLNIRQWADQLGIPAKLIATRIRRGWDVAKALTP